MKFITNNDFYTTAKNKMTAATTSGIMSFKSGSDLDMRSKTSMIIKTETDMTQVSGEQWNERVGAFKESVTAQYWDHTSTGDVTIIGKIIELNP